MKIAMLGTRGIPARYSGFETCVEQLGSRLVERGHEVTVYCRGNRLGYEGKTYKNMQLVRIPAIRNKYLETIVHSLFSAIHALFQDFDIGLFFIAGNSLVAWIPRLVGTKTILNVDGLDWEREKWPTAAKAYIRFSEYMATKLPNIYLTDSRSVQASYVDRFRVQPPLYIPYGSELELRPPGDTLRRYGLEPGRYILFVGRLVPENRVHHLIEAFRELKTNLRCVIVGGASYSQSYQKHLQQLAPDDPRITLTGFVFGKRYQELGSNALLFVETSAVGGTHPALIESMAFGNCVIVNNTPANMETIMDAGLSYDGHIGAESLRKVLEEILGDRDRLELLRRQAKQRAKWAFSWEAVTNEYERLFYQVRAKSLPDRLSKPTDME